MNELRPQRKSFFGQGVSPGIAIGPIRVIDRQKITVPQYHLARDEVEFEISRLMAAIDRSDEQLLDIKTRLDAADPHGHGAILEAHRLILRDPVIVEGACRRIREEGVNAEWAVKEIIHLLKERFESLAGTYFRERQADVQFVGDRILRNLLGNDPDLAASAQPAVVVAHDLSPADTAALFKQKVLAFVTSVGGRTSHTAILARALGIPAVVGAEGILAQSGQGDEIIVDGSHGQVILNPTEQERRDYQERRTQYIVLGENLLAGRDQPAQTLDGVRVRLQANIEVPDEVDTVLSHGAEGIGLYRTEFLFLGREQPPPEEEHYQVYRAIAEQMAGKPVTIRTLDVGGDKIGTPMALLHEGNPALGLRAIRYCLKNQEVFRAQLAGILRASVHGPLQIMFPMISGVMELKWARAVLDEVRHDLRRRGLPFREKIPLGCLIETPAAGVVADLLARHCDFFSIGTNDLVQYTLAVDRGNEHVSEFYQPTHPAILRLLRQIIAAARERNLPVTICGEMAGEPVFSLLLVGLGLTELSMNAYSIPVVKRIIRSATASDGVALAEKLATLETADQISHVLREEMERRFPEFSAWW